MYSWSALAPLVWKSLFGIEFVVIMVGGEGRFLVVRSWAFRSLAVKQFSAYAQYLGLCRSCREPRLDFEWRGFSNMRCVFQIFFFIGFLGPVFASHAWFMV